MNLLKNLNSNIIIREYSEADTEQVCNVGKRSWFFTYSQIFDKNYIERRTSKSYSPKNIKITANSSEYTCMYVAIYNNTIIGFAQPSYYNYWDPITYDPHKMMLSRIYLLPEYIGKGIGSKLLETSENWIRAKGFNEYYLFVHKDNKIGRKFYMNKGFKIIKRANDEGEILLKKLIE